ncbi:astacin-like [Neocloeon triangulifer]|uniref:astacin-like n=1 Tax=Neocloeon triangulifer TaxID=2078957 RepID=UPI00286F659E|nr:astacin-like [Neocloeon triangulifer]
METRHISLELPTEEMRSLFICVFLCAFSHCLARDEQAGRYEYYVKPVSHVSPSDIRRGGKAVGNQITGFYTLVAPKQRWPSTTIPYELDAANTFSDAEKALIMDAMSAISDETCLEFVEKTSETSYISIGNAESGCFAQIGYDVGARPVNLQSDGCFGDITTPIHELMHALGFEHEQTRYDRDLYIDIQWENIQDGNADQFEKLPRTYAYPQYEFDFMSLMMYTVDSFGIGGRPSMVLTPKYEKTIDPYQVGRATNFSWTDTERIFSAYGCYAQYQEPNAGARIAGREQTLTIF